MEWMDLANIATREVVPGFHGRFVHSENMTLVWWDVVSGSTLPLHQHPHEQVTQVIEGELELTVNGETRVLKPGAVIVIPGGTLHSGKAVTPCKLFDAFYPIRQEYR